MSSSNRLMHDFISFALVSLVLLIVGTISIYSASSVYALEHCGSPHYYVKQHLIGLLCGFIAFVLVQWFSPFFLRKISFLGLLGALTLTALTLVPGLGSAIHGSSRWLKLGSFTFQPSELIKLGLIMTVAAHTARKNVSQFTLRNYIPLLILLIPTCLLLLAQPDFGLSVTLVLTVIGMLFAAELNLFHLVLALSSFIPVALWLVISKPYRFQRILTFLNPWKDPQGSGFQVIQSLIAIGSGGLFGKGIGQSHQKFFYLPMQHTDFIFSIIAEETGFIGASMLVLLFVLFLFFGIRLATALTDHFCALTTIGFVLLINLQALINLCVASGIAPTKGIGLPFISYGNSALVVHLIMLGIITRFVRSERRLRFGKNSL